MLVFCLNVKKKHLFKLAYLKNYCTPKHNGPAFQLAVELVPSQVLFRSRKTYHISPHFIQALYTRWSQDSDELPSSVVLHSAGSQSSSVWFAQCPSITVTAVQCETLNQTQNQKFIQKMRHHTNEMLWSSSAAHEALLFGSSLNVLIQHQ